MSKRLFIDTFINLFNNLSCFFVKRDYKVWLFGSWMGKRFSDNSRFLFQYLTNNMDKYGIKKTIWVTRNNEILELTRSMGYESYLIGTKESKYWHKKAGVHVICNSMNEDIDSKFSFGAKKIQLWHGNGIKASGKMTRKHKETIKDKIWDSIVKPLIIPGNWYHCYWLACSEESKRVLVNDSGALKRKVIIANSPRLCKCQKYLPLELNIIEAITKLKKDGFKIILYLPTFRNGTNSAFVEPTNISNFDSFLQSEKIIWIRKQHFATNENLVTTNNQNIIDLDKTFDVNVLYDYIDLFISDYSSASTDAIYHDIRTLEYCPDYYDFCSNDRGFVAPFDKYHTGNLVLDPNLLIRTIRMCLNTNLTDNKNHKSAKSFLFDDNVADYHIITEAIIKFVFKRTKI